MCVCRNCAGATRKKSNIARTGRQNSSNGALFETLLPENARQYWGLYFALLHSGACRVALKEARLLQCSGRAKLCGVELAQPLAALPV
jgi:hypothetical protein